MSQEKLTLEHLSAYLPYGLDLQVTSSFYGYNTMKLCDKSGLSNIEISNVIDEAQDFKPILRPLSDLEYDCDSEKTPEHLQGCMYSYVQFLLSQHFDVFGLIDKGLAVSIHDVG